MERDVADLPSLISSTPLSRAKRRESLLDSREQALLLFTAAAAAVGCYISSFWGGGQVPCSGLISSRLVSHRQCFDVQPAHDRLCVVQHYRAHRLQQGHHLALHRRRPVVADCTAIAEDDDTNR